MGDEFELTRADRLPPRLSHRRILLLMAGIIAVGSLIGAAFVSGGFGGGVLTGGIVAFLNYFWQRSSTRIIFEKAATGEPPTLLSIRYFFRYLMIGAVVAFFYATGALPITAVILGLGAFTFAVVAEGILSIFLRRT